MSDSPFNEAGEPYMTAAAEWAYEQSLDAESAQYDDYYDDGDYYDE